MSIGNVALDDLNQARRARRTEDIDWFEQLYRAYVTVILTGLGVIYATTIIGDARVSRHTLARVAEHGPAVIGLACLAALFAGARSGARGGPMALEAPFVQHVLLSPIDRDRALRLPARRLLRQAVLLGATVGALAGLVAGQRLPVRMIGLMAGAAGAGAATAAGTIGVAMLFSGRRLSMWLADLAVVPLAGLAAADVARQTSWSPTTWLGRLALAGVRAETAPSAAAVVMAAALALGGLAVVGRTSIEASLRRAGLVSGIKFAVNSQDVRTFVLLQRRLAQDHARATPWVRIRRGSNHPAWRRGWQGLLRLPARRLARMGVLAAVSIAACAGVWRGTTVLIVVAGLALHAVALDAVEPVAQELDRPTRWGSFPHLPGRLLLLLLTAPVALLAIVAIALVGGVAAVSSGEIAGVVAIVALSACISSIVGGAATIATPAFQPSAVTALTPPEAAGMTLVFRMLWPVVVTTLGFTPLLVARAAAQRGDPPAAAALGVIGFLAIPVVAAATWLQSRKPVTL
ncbi:MAG: hypothetical protein QOI47_122 [Actinomycetota bacterium]|nr:hypothetical protein [Actinomycetota bacterium]